MTPAEVAYQEGMEARRTSFDDNPYIDTECHEAWRRGWIEQAVREFAQLSVSVEVAKFYAEWLLKKKEAK